MSTVAPRTPPAAAAGRSPATRMIQPLVVATTYRRGAFLLLGGVLLLPYGLVGVGLARLAADDGTPSTTTRATGVP
ncbi:hypothetical protein AB0C29_36905, partial [Actinoplanes sp. NPDC048791]